METPDMKKMTLWLPHEQIKKLNAISEQTGAPVAELIRRAIKKMLETHTQRGRKTR